MLHLLDDGNVYEPAPADCHGSDNLAEPPASRARAFAANVGVLAGLRDEQGKEVWTPAKYDAKLADINTRESDPTYKPEPVVKLSPLKQVLLGIVIIALVTLGVIAWTSLTGDKKSDSVDSAAPAPVAAVPAQNEAAADKANASSAADNKQSAEQLADGKEEAAPGSAAAALPGKVKDSNPTCTDVPAFIPTQSMPEVDSKLCTSLNTKELKNTFAYGTIDSTPEVVNELKEGKFLTGEATQSQLKPAVGTDIVIHTMPSTDLTVAYVIIDEDSFIQVNASQPGADIEAILKDAGFTA